MNKNRYINTKFWTDNYIVELDPIEKLLFIYLLTNPLTSIAGIYEISLRQIAFDTGIDRDMVKRILGRFKTDKRIDYMDGWIIIKNFLKHQKINPMIQKGIDDILNNLPHSLHIAYDSLSKPLNYSNSNTNINSNSNSNTNSNNNSNDNTNIGKRFAVPSLKDLS